VAKKLPNKVGPWVTGNEFFDRIAEVERLTQLLDQNNSLLLVAPRRIGKTSLVRETFRRMEERGKDYQIFVDVQDCSSPEDVLVQLSMAAQRHGNLADKVKDAFAAFWQGFRDNVESVGTGELLELRFREGITGDWRAKADKVIQNLAKADRPIVICLDELPVMLNRLMGGSGSPVELRATAEIFLSWLRRTMSTYPEKIRWIICGSIGLEPILAKHNLSFTIGNLRAFHLPPWDRKTADACLKCLAANEGESWPKPSREALLDRLEHFVPHHVQMYFGHVMDDCRLRSVDVPTAEDVDRVWESQMLSVRGHAELADYEERLLRVLNEEDVPLALDLLTQAAVVGHLTVQATQVILRRYALESPDKSLRHVLGVVEHDGYLERGIEGDSWFFVSPLIKDWWRRRFGMSYRSVDMEQEP